MHAFNRTRLAPCVADEPATAWLDREVEHRRDEVRFVEEELAAVRGWAREAPHDPDRFVAWFEHLCSLGPGQGDPLFPWLAREADASQMRWFLAQECAGEAGFDDLVALSQLKLPPRAKLEMARNYWDELGRGKESGMHGPMLDRLADELDLAGGEPVWESLALANLMLGMAANRCFALQSIGALGVIELTAPGRAEQVNAGLKRIGVSGQARRYFALHAALDVKHSLAWNREVLAPLVAADPRAATALAEGALARLAAGARCFGRYRLELWGDGAERDAA